MTISQQKIGSGFGARSTAAEVVSGLDLTDKLAIVTGGYSGIGLETTRALRRAGADVIVPARRPDAAHDALRGLDRVEIDALDLGDLESVRAFAERVLQSDRSVDILINNAGIMACPETRVGPGWEAQFATNHLGHYALTNRLWPLLVRGGARVVELSSGGHRRSGIHWDDVQFEHRYDKWEAYGQSKTANALFAVRLDQVGRTTGVRAFAVDPGGILTPLQRHLPKQEMVALGWIDETGKPLIASFKTPEQGAATQVWCATSPQLSEVGGVYCEDCDIAEVVAGDDRSAGGGVREYAIAPDQAARLWTLSAELSNLDAPSAST